MKLDSGRNILTVDSFVLSVLDKGSYDLFYSTENNQQI